MARQFAVICLAVVPLSAQAGDLSVRIDGIGPATGAIACSLFTSDRGFPSDTTGTPSDVHPARDKVTCRFEKLPAGRYAVVAAHFEHGERKMPTDWLGRPTEAWGISKNIRPTLRAPRFDEAAINVPADGSVTITIHLAK